jgi:predicted RNA binding protein YcfA (HicA-like mRNA interferase family)
VVSGQQTRRVVKELRAAGFGPRDAAGSHTWWRHESGASVAVPDGHKTISPGVYRQVIKAINASKEEEER